MAEERPRRRSGRMGTSSIVVIVALVAIAGAWLVATFSSSIGSAAQSTQDRVAQVFMSDEEEIEQAVENYVQALNYEGSDGEEYKAQMDRVVVEGEYYSSPVGAEFAQWPETLDDSVPPLHYSEEIEEWELEDNNGRSASGTVTTRAEWYFGDDQPETGVGSTDLLLTKDEGKWKVSGAENYQEFSEDTSEE